MVDLRQIHWKEILIGFIVGILITIMIKMSIKP